VYKLQILKLGRFGFGEQVADININSGSSQSPALELMINQLLPVLYAKEEKKPASSANASRRTINR
jgi:hypothetical protein